MARCSRYAFELTTDRIKIAFLALFFVVYVALACVAAVLFLRSRSKGRALLRWWALAVSIFFGLLHFILEIVIFSLMECEIGDYLSLALSYIVPTWLDELARYLLVAVVMVPIIRHLHRNAEKTAKLITTVHAAYLAVLAMLLVAFLGLYTFIRDSELKSYYYTWFDVNIFTHYQRVLVAFYSMEVIGILMATVSMAILMARDASHWGAGLKAWVVILAVAALGMTVTRLAADVDALYMSHSEKYLVNSANAALFLSYFFYSCTFAAAVFVATFHELPEGVSSYPPPQTGVLEEPYKGQPRY